MSKLKEKSEFNIDAAELLLKNSCYAPSVHCSYYSCFQLMKHSIYAYFNIEYGILASNISTAGGNTHQYIINYISKELKTLKSIRESQNFKRDIKDLKQFRIESDYDNVEVRWDVGQKALSIATDLRMNIKENFKL